MRYLIVIELEEGQGRLNAWADTESAARVIVNLLATAQGLKSLVLYDCDDADEDQPRPGVAHLEWKMLLVMGDAEVGA